MNVSKDQAREKVTCPGMPFDGSQVIMGGICAEVAGNLTELYQNQYFKEKVIFLRARAGKLPTSSLYHYTNCVRNVLPKYSQRFF